MKTFFCFTLNLIVLSGFLTFSSICFAQSYDTIPANNSEIEYTGRIDFSNPLAPMFSYSGVSIRANFSGTSVAAIMNDDLGQNYYNIILDGEVLEPIKIDFGKKKYVLAEGLDSANHEIELFKRTELTFGKTQFFGFVVDEGTTLLPIADTREKRIEFIGNSITCGYGNEGLNGGTFGPTTENHYLTYAAITSRNFNARHMAVCRSGIGIYRNYDGSAAGDAECMTNLYTRTFLYDENPKYSFSETPDLVCIDLGTNDFSTTGGDSAKFVSNYLRLIDTIQAKYTMPDIICLLGPMMSGTTLTSVRKYLNAIVTAANLKAKGNVYFFEMSEQTGDLGIAIDYHPTVAQHKRNAMELTNYIKTLKGWKITPLAITASVTGVKHIKIEFNTPINDTLNEFAGFELYGENEIIINKSAVYLDSTSDKIIHILLQENLTPGQKLYLSYVPGTIVSDDSVLVAAINKFNIQNNLTETKITKAEVLTNGETLALTFNKKIKESSTTVGLTITENDGTVVIDSFKISYNMMMLYLNKSVPRGDSVFVAYSGTTILGADEIPLNSYAKLVVLNNSSVTNISELKQDIIEVYPNPNSSGTFYFYLNKPEVSKGSRVEVYASNGAVVYNQVLLSSNGMIDLNGKISQGAYIFKFSIGESVVTKSVVVQ